MSRGNDHERLVAIFDRHRQTPGTPFDPAHFREYLLRAPGNRGGIRNSFFGLRRLSAFIDDVQLDFGICFSLKDWESDQSLDRFVERIEQLRRAPRGSLISLRNQKRAGFGWPVVAVVNLALVVCVFLLRHFPIASYVPSLLLLVLNALVIGMWWKRQKYIACLQLLLNAAVDRSLDMIETTDIASSQRQSP